MNSGAYHGWAWDVIARSLLREHSKQIISIVDNFRRSQTVCTCSRSLHITQEQDYYFLSSITEARSTIYYKAVITTPTKSNRETMTTTRDFQSKSTTVDFVANRRGQFLPDTTTESTCNGRIHHDSRSLSRADNRHQASIRLNILSSSLKGRL